jgi:hypothetical protein
VKNVVLSWIKFPVKKMEQKYSILGNLYNFSLHENILIFSCVRIEQCESQEDIET